MESFSVVKALFLKHDQDIFLINQYINLLKSSHTLKYIFFMSFFYSASFLSLLFNYFIYLFLFILFFVFNFVHIYISQMHKITKYIYKIIKNKIKNKKTYQSFKKHLNILIKTSPLQIFLVNHINFPIFIQ